MGRYLHWQHSVSIVCTYKMAANTSKTQPCELRALSSIYKLCIRQLSGFARTGSNPVKVVIIDICTIGAVGSALVLCTEGRGWEQLNYYFVLILV